MYQREDVLGYLAVLGGKVYNSLSADERLIADSNLLGCLSRLRDQMENDPSLLDVYEAIKEREYLNATLNLPVGHPQLQAATDTLAEMLLGLLRNEVPASKKKEFLDRFDNAIAQIMRSAACPSLN